MWKDERWDGKWLCDGACDGADRVSDAPNGARERAVELEGAIRRCRYLEDALACSQVITSNDCGVPVSGTQTHDEYKETGEKERARGKNSEQMNYFSQYIWRKPQHVSGNQHGSIAWWFQPSPKHNKTSPLKPDLINPIFL